jgi:hypothetical protein
VWFLSPPPTHCSPWALRVSVATLSAVAAAKSGNKQFQQTRFRARGTGFFLFAEPQAAKGTNVTGVSELSAVLPVPGSTADSTNRKSAVFSSVPPPMNLRESKRRARRTAPRARARVLPETAGVRARHRACG